CVRYNLVHQVLMLITQLLVSGAMMLRIYALYGRSTRVLWWLIGIASGFTAVAAWSFHDGQHGLPLTVLSGCHLAIFLSSVPYSTCFTHSNLFSDLAGSWECLFAFDSIIFGMISYKAYSTRRTAGNGQCANMPIHQVLVRDGTAMALANLSNIVTFFVRPSRLAAYAISYAYLPHLISRAQPLLPGSLATFATCMSVVMMARLMLNLHERADVGVLTGHGIYDELVFAGTESLPLRGSSRG
ncbi:hypothetical protein FB451DRAFT_1033128, partial [Mycena latifolia]